MPSMPFSPHNHPIEREARALEVAAAEAAEAEETADDATGDAPAN